MTNKQKARLAWALIQAAGNLIEFYGEIGETEALAEEGVSKEDAAKVLSSWLAKLPGDSWSVFLPVHGEKA